MSSSELEQIVDEHLRGCVPPSVPPCYREIVGARPLIDKRERRVIEADMVMFDGAAAAVRLTEHRMVLGQSVWSHRWIMDSAVFWDDGAWRRHTPGAFAWDTISKDVAGHLEAGPVRTPVAPAARSIQLTLF